MNCLRLLYSREIFDSAHRTHISHIMFLVGQGLLQAIDEDVGLRIGGVVVVVVHYLFLAHTLRPLVVSQNPPVLTVRGICEVVSCTTLLSTVKYHWNKIKTQV